MKHFNFKHLKGEIETCWMERKSNLAYIIFDALKKQDQKKACISDMLPNPISVGQLD